MELEYLNTECYRNSEKGHIEFAPGVNQLCGRNGAGKTNALEAICFFAVGKSMRTSRQKELILHGENHAAIDIGYHSTLEEEKKTKSLAIRFENDLKKFSAEGVTVERVSDFLGRFRAVLFTPDHLSLVKGGPEQRRHFADMALSQIRPGYIRLLNSYARTIAQKNQMLKTANGFEDRVDKELLRVYNERLAVDAARITRQRVLFSEYIEEKAAAFYADIAGGKEQLYVRYANVTKQDLTDVEKSTDRFRLLYENMMMNEIRAGISLYGPHRDDMIISLGRVFEEDIYSTLGGQVWECAARTFGSQGQQRSAVLSLKLAEGEIIRELTGEYPVFLFDDVLSELDVDRRSLLLSLFRDGDRQVILTGCDTDAVDPSLISKTILVENGVYHDA